MISNTANEVPPIEVDALLQRLDDAIGDVKDTVVTGTLSGWKINNRRWGHGDLCVTSEGGDGIGARLPLTVPPAVTYAAQRRHPDRLAAGAEAVVHGQVEIGDRWNPLRLVATRLDILDAESRHTAGRRELLEQLTTSGAAARNRALELPATLTRIGLVTPASGEAGRADFLERLALNPAPIGILERRVPMSGPAAPQAIATAIDELAGLTVDAVVVCRGGGATAELAAFDSPAVASAIVRSERPVIVAVGHAVDRSIADHVAHTSVPTPTAAADSIVSRTIATATAAREHLVITAAAASTTHARQAQLTAQRERARVEASRRRARIALVAAVGFALGLALIAARSVWL